MLFRLMIFLVLLCGSVSAAEPIPLKAGPLTMVFDPDNALLRYVRIGEQKVLQGINAPVRDRFWGTVPPSVRNVKLDEDGDSFVLSFDVSCRQGDIDFDWKGRVSGNSDGRVTYSFDGQAQSTFLRNRIGFCILHGPEAAGRPCVIETVDGKKVEGRFPNLISPHQPFKNIRAITHEVTEGVWATVRMEGDTFEMEDQRNWTDASFKTYCTPLELSYPVRVAEGTRIAHRIEITIKGAENVSDQAYDGSRAVALLVARSSSRKRLPAIGLQVSSQEEKLTKTKIARLRALNLDHLRVTLSLPDDESIARLTHAAEQAKQLGVELHVGLHPIDSPEGWQQLDAALKEIQPPSTWLLIAANDRHVADAREFLKRSGQNGRLGRGEDTNFTELNRSRPDPDTVDLMAYGVNPQIHAFDNTSMSETLEIQGDTIRTAREFAGDLPLLVSPITLRKQTLDEVPASGELPANVDPRQVTSFAAGWTLGSIKYLAEAGASGATYFETVGWLGIMESENGNPLPSRFRSRPGGLYPIYHLLRQVADFSGGYVLPTKSSDSMSVVGLALEKGDRRRLLVANLTSVDRTATVKGFGRTARRRSLDPKSLVDATPLSASGGEAFQLKLLPYSVTILDPE